MSASIDLGTYAAMANKHRPTDPDLLAAEIRRLHATGLTARDIATALRLQLDAVINVLERAPE
jgi:hypothetical protein